MHVSAPNDGLENTQGRYWQDKFICIMLDRTAYLEMAVTKQYALSQPKQKSVYRV